MRLAVDIGGTFTDIVLDTGRGLISDKILTTPAAPEQAVIEGVAQLLGRAGLAPQEVTLFIHGTTLATNALIERKGAQTAFLTTEGFRDILETGYEKRFEHYDIYQDKPEPLVPRERRLTVPERMSARGEMLLPLDEAAIEHIVSRLDGIESLAIGFLHAYAWPAHERRARELLRARLPDLPITLSSDVSAEMREYERFSTAVANAYVQPLMAGYLGRLRQALDERGLTCPFFVMMSGGGLTTLEQASAVPIRLVESGPAGGAVLAGKIARELGLEQIMAFDMGGTTAKISLIRNGEPDRARLFEVARAYRGLKGSGLPVRIPVIEMVEIGAGGGSIARIDAMRRITVGPDSAGADPGPAAYGRGGVDATVTDANLVLGKLDAERFAGGKLPLDSARAEAALVRSVGEPLNLEAHWPAAGVVEIVEESMANAANVHAIERGRTASEHTLVAFGGGAPLHAARLAQKLGMRHVVVPTGAGVGSAIGFLAAPLAYEIVQSRPERLDRLDADTTNRLLIELTDTACAVVAPAAGGSPLATRIEVDLRYLGQGHELTLAVEPPLSPATLADLRARFQALYGEIYGVTLDTMPVETVTWSVTVSTATPPILVVDEPAERAAPAPVGSRLLFDGALGRMSEAALHWRRDLPPGASGMGPAIIAEDETSTVVPEGFAFRIDGRGYIHLEQRT